MVGVRGGLLVTCGFLPVCFCLVDFVCLLFVGFFAIVYMHWRCPAYKTNFAKLDCGF